MSEQDKFVGTVIMVCSVIGLIVGIVDILFLRKFHTYGVISRKSILVPQGTVMPIPIDQGMPSCRGLLYIKCDKFPEVMSVEVGRKMYERFRVGNAINITYTKSRIFSTISISVPGVWPEPDKDIYEYEVEID